MGLVIIFGLVTLLAGAAVLSSFKNKNYLGLVFALGAFAVFGWFTFMTVLHSGYPAA